MCLLIKVVIQGGSDGLIVMTLLGIHEGLDGGGGSGIHYSLKI